MARGRQANTNREINWVTDEDGNVLGYMKDAKTLVTTAEYSIEQSSRTDISGVVASAASGVMIAPGGKVITTFKTPYQLPTPVLLNSYNAGTATTSGSIEPTNGVVKYQPDTAAQVGKTLITSINGGTVSMTAQNNTDSMHEPSKMGTISALFYVSGKKSERGIAMQNSSGLGFSKLSIPDSATTPLLADGYMWLAYHVSEFAAFSALPGLHTITPRLNVGLAGNDGVTKFAPGPVYCNAAGRPKVSITFDDISDNQKSIFAVMDSLGLVGTINVPSAQVNQPGKLTLADLQERKEKGWPLCTNATPNDASVSTDIPTAIANLNADRQYLIDNNLASNGSENHGCWPYGSFDVARVNAFKAAGMLTMRGTAGMYVHDRFGLGSIGLTLPAFAGGVSTWANLASFEAAIDLAIKRGSSIHIYYHQILESGATGLNTNVGLLTQQLTSLAAKRDAKLVDVVNITEYYDTVKDNSPPVIY